MPSRPSESVAIIATIDPDAYAASTVTSDWGNMGLFKKAMGIIEVGTLGASATIDAKLQQAQDASGTGVKDITGKSIAQLTQAGTDDDKQVVIDLDAAELDVANGFEYVRISMTIGVAASDAGALLLGLEPRFGPASDNDLASVDEIVN